MQVDRHELRKLLPRLESSSVTFLLETQAPYAGKSYLASHPKLTLTARGNDITLERHDGTTETWSANVWDAFGKITDENPGWWFCALGYDLKNQDEGLSSHNTDPVGLPDLIAIQPSLLIEQNQEGELVFIEGHIDVANHGSSLDKAHVDITGSSTTESDYISTIHRVKTDIHEGEYYELNLSHQLTGKLSGPAHGLYCQMALKGPVPMASFVSYHDTKVVCSSPERYLKRECNVVVSEPIKGTRPRSSDDRKDAALAAELLSSEKERAENLMIVDLVRNDLARVAKKGSVVVERLFEIRSYATVHQMVSTVRADVTPQTSNVEILRRTFPMGSMTGAPKIRVMKAIEALETYRRGLYSGAIGYLAPDGDFDFNVVIRSAFVKGNRVWFPVGGAITSDSDPEAEWDETLVKSRALP